MRHTIGLSIGPPSESTGLVVLETGSPAPAGEEPPNLFERQYAANSYRDLISRRAPPAEPEPLRHAVRRIQRFPPGTSYSSMRDAVGKLLEALADPVVVLDRTGIGTPIADSFRWPKASTIPVLLTAGERDTRARPRRLPRRDVADLLQLALQERRLTIAKSALAADLAKDLRTFDPKPGNGAAGELAWRDRPSDDLVLALCVALEEADRAPVYAAAVPRQPARRLWGF